MRIRIFNTNRVVRGRLAALVAAAALAPLARGHGAAPERLAEVAAALARSPADPALLFAQAGLLVEHGDHALARHDLARADSLAPGRFPVDSVFARLAYAEGDLPAALAALDRAVARDPLDPAPLTLRARVHRALGRRDASLADFRAALALTPRPSGDFALEMADALSAAGANAEAIAVLECGVRSAGQAPSLLVRLVALHVAAGRPAAAVPWAAAMAAHSARPEPWLVRRAELLELAGRPAEARAAWLELRARLAALPSLERGLPALCPVSARVAQALAAAPVR